MERKMENVNRMRIYKFALGRMSGIALWQFCKNRPSIYAGSKQIPLFFGNGLATLFAIFLEYNYISIT